MDEETKEFLEAATVRGQRLMTHLNETHDDPFAAVASCVLAIAALAKGIGMPLETLQEGIESAYSDMSVGEDGPLQ